MELLIGVYLIFKLSMVPDILKVADEINNPQPQVIIIEVTEKKKTLCF
jgi:hypothetical protein